MLVASDFLEEHGAKHAELAGRPLAVLGHIRYADVHQSSLLHRAIDRSALLFPFEYLSEERTYDHNLFTAGNLSLSRAWFRSGKVLFDESFPNANCRA